MPPYGFGNWAPLLAVTLLIASCANEQGSEIDLAPPAAAEVELLVDTTSSWGLDFTHRAGGEGDLVFPEMMGGGVAVFDANNDSDLDLYLISGAPGLGRSPQLEDPPNRLFLQRDRRFVDATEESGLDDRGYGTGVAVADYNNDGNQDVLVTNFGPDRLYRGRGDGTFEDVTATSGIVATGTAWDDWSTSAAFCDFDADGHLDLYVVRYVVFDPEVRCTDKAGRHDYCGPDSFDDRTDVLLRNNGDGTFSDATRTAGIDQATGAGLGVVCADLNADGRLDIYVANDGDPNQLWLNQGNGTFVDDGLIMGASVNAAGLHEAGMGVIAADFDNDLLLDLFVTHLREETNTLYKNLGSGLGFEDRTTGAGLAAASTPYTGFGTAPVDIDLDGDLDIVISNGRVTRGDPLTDGLPQPWSPYAEPNLVYRNNGGWFEPLDAGAPEVAPFTAPIEIGRGLASGDLDGDGDLDLVLNSIESPARIVEARPGEGRHWLIVDAVDPRLNRRALGAEVVVESSSGRQLRLLDGAMSYLSSSDARAHFGLGGEVGPVSVQVRWPDGLVETFGEIDVDQHLILQRGQGDS